MTYNSKALASLTANLLTKAYGGKSRNFNEDQIRLRLVEVGVYREEVYSDIKRLLADLNTVITSIKDLIKLKAPSNIVHFIYFDLKPRFSNAFHLFELLEKHQDVRITIDLLAEFNSLLGSIQQLPLLKTPQLLKGKLSYKSQLLKLINSNLLSNRARVFLYQAVDPVSKNVALESIRTNIDKSLKNGEICFYHFAFDESNTFDENFMNYGLKKTFKANTYLVLLHSYALVCNEKNVLSEIDHLTAFPKFNKNIINRTYELFSAGEEVNISKSEVPKLLRGLLELETKKFIKIIFPQKTYSDK